MFESDDWDPCHTPSGESAGGQEDGCSNQIRHGVLQRDAGVGTCGMASDLRELRKHSEESMEEGGGGSSGEESDDSIVSKLGSKSLLVSSLTLFLVARENFILESLFGNLSSSSIFLLISCFFLILILLNNGVS